MKTRLLAILFAVLVCLGTSAFAQDSLGFTNKAEAKNLTVNGLKEGKWVEYYDSNNNPLKIFNMPDYSLIIYKKGKPTGIVRTYNKDILYGEIPYIDGKINGVAKWFYPNGILYTEVGYKDSVENGLLKQYYKTGELRHEYSITYGKINGLQKTYYKSGKILNEGIVSNDGKTGVEKSYYENGKLKGETNFHKGKKNGVERCYSESGKLRTETTYIKDSAIATKSYDENGNEIK